MSKRILIIGQGIAGTCAAWEAEKAGHTYTIMDRGATASASAVSSGLINPITGRNFVKSWMIDAFVEASVSTYSEMGIELKLPILHQVDIIRHIASIEAENIWHNKSLLPGYESLMKAGPAPDTLSPYLSEISALGTVTQSYRVDVSQLLTGMRERWLQADMLVDEVFEADQVSNLGGNGITYRGESYDAVIMAIGWKGQYCHLFETDVYRPAKGEVLLVRIPRMPTHSIIKHHKFIVPQGNDLFWIGTTWQWVYDDADTEDKKSQELVDFLDRYLKVDYEVIARYAGIRPATKYRRPLVGSHKSWPRLFLLNGLGTKGVTMAPYWAKQLISHITTEELTKPISISEAHQWAFGISQNIRDRSGSE